MDTQQPAVTHEEHQGLKTATQVVPSLATGKNQGGTELFVITNEL